MKGRFEDYAHVLRLVAIFAAGLVLFLMLRAWLVPDDFGVYGHYRARALDANRDHPVVFAGAQACIDCHGDVAETRAAGRHATVSCEACHGALAAHAAGESDEIPARPDPRVGCERCHDARAGKPVAFPQVDVADHAPEGACTACHQPHSPVIQ
ncbi:MAG: hypothetical protein KJ066_18580 [Acidobacteria bacterium]|nr:hypothetical protein [Acidobacteriota bacterium]